jgi:hypothetical protein
MESHREKEGGVDSVHAACVFIYVLMACLDTLSAIVRCGNEVLVGEPLCGKSNYSKSNPPSIGARLLWRWLSNQAREVFGVFFSLLQWGGWIIFSLLWWDDQKSILIGLKNGLTNIPVWILTIDFILIITI